MQVEGQRGFSLLNLPATGARVRNTYATYLLLGHNPEKSGLIPHNISMWHHIDLKDLLITDGHAHD